jgi:3D (Asp-Asp-Asp) domain-containing protein
MGFLLLTATPSADASTTSPVVKAYGPELTVNMTGYNAVPGQTDGDPFTTASGAYSDPNIVAARSVDLAKKLPFGTVIAIESASDSSWCGYNPVSHLIGLRVIADSMNPKMHNKVDILLPQSAPVGGREANPARVLGMCKGVTIRVVGRIAIANIPKTQSGLAAMVGTNGELAEAK